MFSYTSVIVSVEKNETTRLRIQPLNFLDIAAEWKIDDVRYLALTATNNWKITGISSWRNGCSMPLFFLLFVKLNMQIVSKKTCAVWRETCIITVAAMLQSAMFGVLQLERLPTAGWDMENSSSGHIACHLHITIKKRTNYRVHARRCKLQTQKWLITT